MTPSRNNSFGQSLVEVLVAMGVGAIVFVGTAALVAPTLQENKSTSQAQTAIALGKELMDNVRVWSEYDWHNIQNLSTSSAFSYSLVASTSPFTLSSASETVVITPQNWDSRWFYVDDVYRDANGYATSTAAGNTLDPSTKKVTVNVRSYWGGSGAGLARTFTFSSYLTRNRTDVFDQTDWSGGSGFAGPTTSANNRFSSSTNLIISSGGSIQAVAANAWARGYVYRRKITATSTFVAPSGTTLTHFPFLFSGTYSYLAVSSTGAGTLQNSNGYDIMFTSDPSGTSPLYYEREAYSSSTGNVIFWINVPTFSSSSNAIYMFYDSNAVAVDEASSSYTWDYPSYGAIYHMNSAQATTTIKDSSLDAYNYYNASFGTDEYSARTQDLTATSSGQIGVAQYFTQNVDYAVDTTWYFQFGPSGEATLSAWVNSKTTGTPEGYDKILDTQFDYSYQPPEMTLQSNITGSQYDLVVNDGGPDACVGGTITKGGWHYLVGTYDGGTEKLYVDGSQVCNASATIPSPVYGPLAIGTSYVTPGTSGWGGGIDEVHLSQVERSADWIKTEYNNQVNPSAFYSIGSSTLNFVNATGSISASAGQHWAWNDSIGWIDFYNNNNVTVGTLGLTGYASSSVKDVSLDCATTRNGNICATSNYQVLNDGVGNLFGWAWNDAIGWISFCGGQSVTNCPGTTNYRVTIDSGGNFQGWAWNDTIGWIDFNCDNDSSCGTSNFDVKTAWQAPSSTTGTLDSSIFDTGIASGSQLNSIMWQGIPSAGSIVQFQVAASNSSSGPWNFSGPDGTANTYYTPVGFGSAVSLNYNLYDNLRYFRYRVFITSANHWSATVNDIVVNWSP